MANVFDVARYILRKQGPMSTAKLQKLVYYSQAWSLVWDEKPLFREKIQAWANGPVIPTLFREHQGRFNVNADCFPQGKVKNLNKDQKETIDSILSVYGKKSAQWLIDLTHLEDPWKNAREDCKPGEKCTNEITQGAMYEYYSSL